MKKVTREQLNSRVARGATLKRETPEAPPAPDVEEKDEDDSRLVSILEKLSERETPAPVDQGALVQAMVTSMREASEMNQSREPTPYEAIIIRRKDGLIDRVEFRPIKSRLN